MFEALRVGELRVYYAMSAIATAAGARCRALLSEAERDQHERFRFEQDRNSYLAAHALTRAALGRLLGTLPSELVFEPGSRGRPELVLPRSQPRLRFNLSHTRGLVACALALEADVGVDVERVDRKVDIEQLAPSVFSQHERAGLADLLEPDRRRRFFELWTLKEAYIKATGHGLALPLQQISLDVRSRPPSLRLEAAIADDASRWHFELCSFESRYMLAAAVALRAPAPVGWREVSARDL